MISNPYKADLLACRLDTLELMRELAWKLKANPHPVIEETIRALGEISQEYTKMIAAPTPEKWVRHYELMQKFHARQ